MSSKHGFRTTTNEVEIFRRLREFHGVDPDTASLRLHRLKSRHGLQADDNVIFDLTGNVYRESVTDGTLYKLGMLTARD